MILACHHDAPASAAVFWICHCVGVFWDANLSERASGTLDGEDTGRDVDGNAFGDRKVELLEDLQHLVYWW